MDDKYGRNDQDPLWHPDPLTRLLTKVEQIEERMKDFITLDEFRPVRAIVFGLVGLILAAVIGALIAKVVTR